MALIIIIFTFLSIFFSYLLPPTCASLQTQVLQPSLLQHQANAHDKKHLSLPRLVRNIRVAQEQVKGYNEARDLASHKQKAYLSEKQHHRKQKKAKRQEWEDPSQYFAKDYNHVGGRRPIHN